MFTQAQVDAIAAAIASALQGLVTVTAPTPPPPPPVDPRVAEIQRLEAAIAELRAGNSLVNLPPPPAPPAPVAVRDVTFHTGPGGERLDDIVPPGTPGTVTMPVTGHVISLPQVAAGESWCPYANRVQAQCGIKVPYQYVGILMYAGDGLHKASGGFKADGSNWPEVADRFYNPGAYASAEEKRLYAENAAREAAGGPGTWAAMDEAYRTRSQGLQPRVTPTPKPPAASEDVPISS